MEVSKLSASNMVYKIVEKSLLKKKASPKDGMSACSLAHR
jgi:hypothetical protein